MQTSGSFGKSFLFIGVLAGTHYNRAWTIHSTFLEPLERLLMPRFIRERNITFSDEIKECFAEDNCNAFDDSIVNMLNSSCYSVRIK